VKTLIDIVNFNADASCLPADTWLEALKGGELSLFRRWLSLYIERGKRLVLGLTGATIADLACFNPESLALIRANRDIFQIIARPFAHDVALLRTPRGFARNIEFGIRTLEKEFGGFESFFLPPEFMLTTEQIGLLWEQRLLGTFINAERYSEPQRDRIPASPYRLSGPFGIELACVPVAGRLTRGYLSAHDHLDADAWNRGIIADPETEVRVWRDGESWLLIPQGLEREAIWLDHEDPAIRRAFLHVPPTAALPAPEHFGRVTYRSYPLHSLEAWLKELKMLRYVRRIEEIEMHVDSLDADATALWLLSINSDILSSVEKRPITKRMKAIGTDNLFFETILHRCERGFEGAEYLALLERQIAGGDIGWLHTSPAAHMAKARARWAYCRRLWDERETERNTPFEEARGGQG
jgi:hypothetical protein